MREFLTHVFKQQFVTGEQTANAAPIDPKKKQYCIILLKSGTLKLPNCIMSLE